MYNCHIILVYNCHIQLVYNCHIQLVYVSSFPGQEPLSVTLPIRPGYPSLSILDSLFNDGTSSFIKLAAENPRRSDKKPHVFDFGVGMEESELPMTELSRQKLAEFMESDPETVQMLMEREFARNREKARLKEKRRKPLKVKKLAEKLAEKKMAKTPGDKKREESEPKAKSSDAPLKDKPGVSESGVKSQVAGVPGTESSSKSAVTTSSSATDTKPTRTRKTARDKFRRCENCEQEIADRIQLCSGCKKVAYCNNHCQKAHWKQHKKTCTYVQKSLERDKSVRVCAACDKQLNERVMLCAGCKKVAYCDSTCQKAHWKQHKKTCSYAKKKEADT